MTAPEPLGVLGAMDVEVEAVEAALNEPVRTQVLGCRVMSGTLDGHPLLVTRSGIGKVNATLATAALAQSGAAAMVFLGMAGSVSDEVGLGDAVVATELVQHDVDITAFGHKLGTISGEPAGGVCDQRLSDRVALAAVDLGATVHRGRVASGDQFIHSAQRSAEIAKTFDAVAVEMEGAAFAQACRRLRLPFAVLRWISDAADAHAPADFDLFMREVAALDLAVIRSVVD